MIHAGPEKLIFTQDEENMLYGDELVLISLSQL
jgi:hypothetical protein